MYQHIFSCSFINADICNPLAHRRYSLAFWSNGKIEHVAPNSAPMLQMVALPVVEIPPSYCVLLSDNRNELTRKRLKTLAATTDGFAIAEEDLKLRGPGDFFGARQHGLPQLKLASLEGDMRLLHQAQAAAQEVLARDPNLTWEEHAPLRRRVEQLFRENRDIFN